MTHSTRVGIGVTLVTLLVLCLVTINSLSAEQRRTRLPRPQVGLASFYGAAFQGEETASGEDFDLRDMTAAHRTLPMGSVVRVTNLENGKSVIVRINDRGPYGANHRKGTIIDLSKGAARRLGFIKDGLTRVRLEVLRQERTAEK
ncbi:MAG TPA: septal ring lytic transglycosylase RlpA family protein [Vicinamibacterales bacterium]